MISISQTTQTAGVAANTAADLIENSSAAPDLSTSRTAPPTGAPMAGADPLANFTAQYGLHADVAQVARLASKGAPQGQACKVGSHPNSHPLGSGVDTKSTPAPAYDVAHTSAEQIKKLKELPISEKELEALKHKDVSDAKLASLKKSKDPATRELAAGIEADRLKALHMEGQVRLGVTIENAKMAYRHLTDQGWRVIATTSVANGGQPVLTLVGPNFKAGKDVIVRTHYHGDNATVADPVGSKAGTTTRIQAIVEKHANTVIVLPEAANSKPAVDSPQHDNSYSVNWRHVTSQLQTTADALRAAGITKQLEAACLDRPVQQIVSFHSGGGKVVDVLMAADKTGSRLRADTLELYDSLYGDWQNAVAKWGDTANGHAVKSVLYFHGTNDGWRSKVISDKFGAKFWQVDMSVQKQFKKMSDKEHEQANPAVRGPSGETYPRNYREINEKTGTEYSRKDVKRQYHENPHYRTMGEFFGVGIDLRGI